MKKILSLLAIIAVISACNNNTSDAGKTESAPARPGLDNVEGNIPDSSNTITLNQSLPTDSSKAKDSTPR